jgi:hypothetical protein
MQLYYRKVSLFGHGNASEMEGRRAQLTKKLKMRSVKHSLSVLASLPSPQGAR